MDHANGDTETMNKDHRDIDALCNLLKISNEMSSSPRSSLLGILDWCDRLSGQIKKNPMDHLKMMFLLSEVVMKFINETNINCEDLAERDDNFKLLREASAFFSSYGVAWDMIQRPHSNPDIEPILECWHRMKGLLKATGRSVPSH